MGEGGREGEEEGEGEGEGERERERGRGRETESKENMHVFGVCSPSRWLQALSRKREEE